jgi:hypothetical protein
MAQPLLALGALLLLSTFALTQQRSAMQLHGASHSRDAERVVLDYATELLGRIDGPGILFDQGFAGLDDPLAIRDPSVVLTLPEFFGADIGEDPNDPATYNDVDDFVDFPREQLVDWDGAEVPVNVEIDVQYVDVDPALGEHPIPSDIPTFTKQVTVTVTEDRPAASGRTPATVSLTRLITPARVSLH